MPDDTRTIEPEVESESGPADGAQVDWGLGEVTDGIIQRKCSSWGAVITVDYQLDEATGWVRRIRPNERDGDRSLLVVNLETGVGQLTPQIPPAPDAGDPPNPDCGTQPMEFWFGVEYSSE